MKKLLSLVVLLAMVFAIAGCKRDDRPNFKKADLRIANAAIAEDLDLHTTSLASDFTILGNIMEGLFRLEDGDGIIDGIAKVDDTVISTDGMTYTFKLRQGALWSNGDEITAHDFVYSWQRAVQKHTDITVAYASMFFVIENAEAIYDGDETDVTKLGVKALDNYTLEVKLNKPVPYFMQLMAFPAFFPAHKDTIEKYGIDYGKSAKKLIFNGPFVVKYWNTDYGIYLEKNEKYWNQAAVKINSFSHRLVEDPNTQVSLFDAGEIDRVGLTGAQYGDRKDDANMEVIQDPVTWYLIFNQEVDITANENLRKFFMYAIDKKELVEAMQPYVPADGFLPSGYSILVKDDGTAVDYREFKTENADATALFGDDEPTFNKFDGTNNGIYDAEKAQDYLDAALVDLGKTAIEVDFLCFDAAGWQPLFEQIQFQINEYDNITLNLVKKPAGDVYDSYDASEFEIGFYGWGPDYPDPMTYLELYHSKDSHNVLTDPSADPRTTLNAEYDAIIDLAKGIGEDGEADFSLLNAPVTRYEELVKAEAILLENAYIVPLANRAGGVLTSDRVSGIVDHNFGPDFTYMWVTVTE